MARMQRGFRRTNGYDPRRNNPRDPYSSRVEQKDDISEFCALNLETGEIRNCKNLDHACAFGFGQNKRTHTHKWLVIHRTRDAFICI